MINGRINSNLDAIVELGISNAAVVRMQQFVVDTGFNGFIAVPQCLVERLGLPLRDVQLGITADGHSSFFDTVETPKDRHTEIRKHRGTESTEFCFDKPRAFVIDVSRGPI